MNWISRKFLFSSIVFLVIVLSTAALFAAQAWQEAGKKGFWTDEIFGLAASVKGRTIPQLLFRGAPGQGSCAPLDYVFLRGFHLLYQGDLTRIPPEQFYRMNSILAALTGYLVLMFLFWARVQSTATSYVDYWIRSLLVFKAGTFFLFHRAFFQYWIETRPYAWWLTWFALVMAFFLLEHRWSIVKMILLTALTATMLGGLVQVIMLFVAVVLYEICLEKKMVWQSLGKNLTWIAVPCAVGLYYALNSQQLWGYTNALHEAEQWSRFWLDKEKIWILAISGIIFCHRDAVHRPAVVVFLTMFFLYFLSWPQVVFCFFRGFFFSSRQYLYYDLTFIFFFLYLALSGPFHWKALVQDVKAGYRKMKLRGVIS